MRSWWRKRNGSSPVTEPDADPGASISNQEAGTAAADSGRVVGERGIPSVNRVRSLQSRVSSVLAIAVVAGGVLLAGGATLYIVGGTESEEPEASVRLGPLLVESGAGLLLHGGF